MLDAAVGDGVEALDRSRDLEGFEARQEKPEDGFDLDARDERAHAEVLAETEREMRVRLAVDAELEGRVEDGLVSIRGREVERDLFAGADRRATDLAVLRRRAREVADRADPAQDLLDRVGEKVRVG